MACEFDPSIFAHDITPHRCHAWRLAQSTPTRTSIVPGPGIAFQGEAQCLLCALGVSVVKPPIPQSATVQPPGQGWGSVRWGWRLDDVQRLGDDVQDLRVCQSHKQAGDLGRVHAWNAGSGDVGVRPVLVALQGTCDAVASSSIYPGRRMLLLMDGWQRNEARRPPPCPDRTLAQDRGRMPGCPRAFTGRPLHRR